MKKQTETTDAAGSSAAAASEEAALKRIVGKYNLSKADFDAIIAWKHAHY